MCCFQANLCYDSLKLDCFAVGVVLYALLLSSWPQTRHPGDFAPRSAPFWSRNAQEKHPKWNSLSTGVQDLLRGLLEPDPPFRCKILLERSLVKSS